MYVRKYARKGRHILPIPRMIFSPKISEPPRHIFSCGHTTISHNPVMSDSVDKAPTKKHPI